MLARPAFMLPFVLATCSLVAQARAHDSNPPEFPMVDQQAKPTFARPVINELRAGNLSIVFEKTKLSDLTKLFPQTRLLHRGDASEYQVWVCLEVATPAGHVRLWPSAGEMGGGDTITGVAIAAAPQAPDPDCPLIDVAARAVSLDGNISIGMPNALVHERLGKPSLIEGPLLEYLFELPAPNATMKDCEVVGGLYVEIKQEKVVTLWASKLTSC